MFGWDFLLMFSRDSEDEMWSRFMFELLIWLQEATLARWTQFSGPLCLWQCFLYLAFCVWYLVKIEDECSKQYYYISIVLVSPFRGVQGPTSVWVASPNPTRTPVWSPPLKWLCSWCSCTWFFCSGLDRDSPVQHAVALVVTPCMAEPCKM